jgi:hypothetical protein
MQSFLISVISVIAIKISVIPKFISFPWYPHFL